MRKPAPKTEDWQALRAALNAALDTAIASDMPQPVTGGCIHGCWHLESSTGPVFLKLNVDETAPMFAAERAGLDAIAATQAVRVPRVLGDGVTAGFAWLALEWIDLAEPDERSDRMLGAQLAALHRNESGEFGFDADNFIGATPQINTQADDWTVFFRRYRLLPQIERLAQAGNRELAERADTVARRLPEWLGDHRPRPSLLHGDLWSGNREADRQGQPVLFDPAAYYGDRETDLAMTELFSGFDESFYAAYNDVWPLPEGYARRRDVYNLYHVLNHANLFGGGYLPQANALIDTLLGNEE